MAGIENTKAALQDIHDMVVAFKEANADGISYNDAGKLFELAKDAYSLYKDAMAAQASGEMSDLDFTEIKELFGILTTMVSDVLKSAA